MNTWTLWSYDHVSQLISVLGGSERFHGLCKVFEADFSDHLNAANLAMSNGDLKEVARLIHLMRSESVNIGATALGEALKQIEDSFAQSGKIYTEDLYRLKELYDISVQLCPKGDC